MLALVTASMLMSWLPPGFGCVCGRLVKGPAQVAWPFVVLLPPLMALNRLVRPGKSAAVYLPSTLLRYLAFKLTVDVQQLPALQVGLLTYSAA